MIEADSRYARVFSGPGPELDLLDDEEEDPDFDDEEPVSSRGELFFE